MHCSCAAGGGLTRAQSAGADARLRPPATGFVICAPAHGGGVRKSRWRGQVEGGVVQTVTARSWCASGPGAPAFPRPGRPERVRNLAFCGGRDLSLPSQLGVEERDRWGLLLIWCLLFCLSGMQPVSPSEFANREQGGEAGPLGSWVSQAVRGGLVQRGPVPVPSYLGGWGGKEGGQHRTLAK